MLVGHFGNLALFIGLHVEHFPVHNAQIRLLLSKLDFSRASIGLWVPVGVKIGFRCFVQTLEKLLVLLVLALLHRGVHVVHIFVLTLFTIAISESTQVPVSLF